MTETTHTFSEIRDASNNFLANAGTEALQGILEQFKVGSIQELKPDQYDRFLRVLDLAQKEDEPPEDFRVDIPEFQLRKQEAAKKKERRAYIGMRLFLTFITALILIAIYLLARVVFR